MYTLLRYARVLPVLACVLIVATVSVTVHVGEPPDTRALSLTVTSGAAMFLLIPTIAVAGVFTGARQRRFAGLMAGAGRSQVELLISLSAIQALVGLLGVVAVFMTLVIRTGIWTLPHVPVMGVFFLALVAVAALGQLVGRTWGVVVGAPPVLVLSFMLMALPTALSEPLWLRHLFVATSCCGSSTVLDPSVLPAQTLIWASLFAAVVLISLRRGPGVLKILAGLGVVALAVSTGTRWVDHLGHSPVAARTSAMVCEGASDTKICLWPENTPALEGLTAAALELEQVANTHDITLPEEFTEQLNDDLTRPAGSFYVPNPFASDEALQQSLARATTGDLTHCETPAEGYDIRLALAQEIVTNWWLDQTGQSPQFDRPPPGPEEIGISGDIAPHIEDLMTMIHTCDLGLLP